jgi:hypothetical protein
LGRKSYWDGKVEGLVWKLVSGLLVAQRTFKRVWK